MSESEVESPTATTSAVLESAAVSLEQIKSWPDRLCQISFLISLAKRAIQKTWEVEDELDFDFDEVNGLIEVMGLTIDHAQSMIGEISDLYIKLERGRSIVAFREETV